MSKKNLIAAILFPLAFASSASAAERTFELTYQGFFAEHDNAFDAEKILEVEITVDDRNGDGSYSHDELVALLSGNIQNHDGFCGFMSCVTAFSWTPGSEPSYFASYAWNNTVDFTQSTIHSGVEFTEFFTSNFGLNYDYTWKWTDATQSTVTEITAVPEPATCGMLLIGLAGIAVAARRRRR
ncbi:PEP-CTERM sorting domain-containing protein [Pseudoduganella sp. SL102]|uniref:PEP-CTERM sorting domain-containing protein n=1 Tax=Pseudoduganella sp. SL102 TaxID=2995154 RepID=UPI00248C7A4E|nr:PEP-CTERM sorting domain-containing protein [Pseudoduganella sp. SL102]WBS02413.1 PEP-CTERM sorting domain-containing protein [Pseudoduganella sp. SL102]